VSLPSLLAYTSPSLLYRSEADLHVLPHSFSSWPRLVGFWLINCQSIGFTLGLVMISSYVRLPEVRLSSLEAVANPFPFALLPSHPSNIGGYTKRSVTSTMVFIGYCVGNILGPLFVFPEEKPIYRSAAYAM
jgi:hypothetical protein